QEFACFGVELLLTCGVDSQFQQFQSEHFDSVRDALMDVALQRDQYGRRTLVDLFGQRTERDPLIPVTIFQDLLDGKHQTLPIDSYRKRFSVMEEREKTFSGFVEDTYILQKRDVEFIVEGFKP